MTEARTQKAKHLLATTNRSIKDITAASGFRNANYMKSAFKRIIGMTMRDYRTKMQKPRGRRRTCGRVTARL